MREPFHHYHARRQLERDTALPTLDAPAVTVRLRRKPGRRRELPMKLVLAVAFVFAALSESIS